MTEKEIPTTEIVEVETLEVQATPEIEVLPPRPRKVYAGMWGVPEIAAVSVSALVALLVVVIYFFWVIPSDRELARNRSEADRLEAEVASARSKYGEITDTQTQVEKLVISVDDFESRFLPISTTGQTALYQKINGLIAAYGLVNTSGPDYSPLETSDIGTDESSSDEKGRSKFRSLYPGVYVSMTVEGSYQNLRRFIREIETGRDFIIVSAVELAPSDVKGDGAGAAAQPNVVEVKPTFGGPNGQGVQGPNGQTAQAPARLQAQGKTHGEIVSLRIELAAYFRRPNFAPTSVQ